MNLRTTTQYEREGYRDNARQSPQHDFIQSLEDRWRTRLREALDQERYWRLRCAEAEARRGDAC